MVDLEGGSVAELIILGSSNAIPDENHENTHMALKGNSQVILVDCVSNPMVRLKQAKLDYQSITDLVLTHFHPDHVSGVPSFLMSSWLLGRKSPLTVYGLDYTLERITRLMEFYDWHSWPNFFPVKFQSIPATEHSVILESDEFLIHASPVRHLVPTIGLRINFLQRNKVVAYSCDTEPCDEVVRLADGADILIHEASGKSLGHSSAAAAGSIARRAEVGKLYLIHYPTGNFPNGNLVPDAQGTFGGPVSLAKDFMVIDI